VKPHAAAQQCNCYKCHYTIWTADFKGAPFQVLLGREDLAASLQHALSQLQADQQVCLRLSLFPSPKPSSFVTPAGSGPGPLLAHGLNKPHQTIAGLQLVSWPGCRVVMPIPPSPQAAAEHVAQHPPALQEEAERQAAKEGSKVPATEDVRWKWDMLRPVVLEDDDSSST
jgi:hypothetical protein